MSEESQPLGEERGQSFANVPPHLSSAAAASPGAGPSERVCMPVLAGGLCSRKRLPDMAGSSQEFSWQEGVENVGKEKWSKGSL